MTTYSMQQEIKLTLATKAFINHQGKVLVIRQAKQYSGGLNAGLFDVVGGRMNPGERFDECLRREVQEETGLQITIGKPFFVGEWRPIIQGLQWQVVGVFFECFTESNTVHLSEDHNEHQWIDPKKFADVPLLPNLHLAFEAYLTR